ncbi:MAG: DUF3108 domain-containing protein [Bacteroidales bacterium]|jgi:hypothetical protein|nr:DUF3108 domain-containing protein [Bacteroidales bacterium]
MKKVFQTVVIIATAFLTGNANAQESFFPQKEGTVLVYSDANASGKVQSQTRQTITKVSGTEANRTIDYTVEILDDKGKSLNPPQIVNLSINIHNGVVVYDLKSMFAAASLANMEVSVKGKPITIPADIQPGQTLEDGDAEVQIAFMKMTVALTDGKCLAIEDITTPAGTFSCVKVAYKSASKAIGIKGNGTIITWYAKGVGIVKQEVYNEKDKLQTTQTLQSIKN